MICAQLCPGFLGVYVGGSSRRSEETVESIESRLSVRWLLWYYEGHTLCFANLDELVTSLLCFLHDIIDQFHNTWDKKITRFRTTIFIPCDKMFDKGGVSSDSSVDLSRRDFWAMMYYGYCQGKSFQECFQSLKHCFGDQSPPKASVLRWFSQLHVWSENVGRRWPLWSNDNDRYPSKRL